MTMNFSILPQRDGRSGLGTFSDKKLLAAITTFEYDHDNELVHYATKGWKEWVWYIFYMNKSLICYTDFINQYAPGP